MKADKTPSLKFSSTLILLIGVLLLNKNVASQKMGLPILQQTEIPQFIIEKIEYFKGKELYGYINGGAEIYLEYGFEKMAMQSINHAGDEITIEIYHMRDPVAALGIFSAFNRNCSTSESIGSYSCLSKYQLNFVRGNFYVNITNIEGTTLLQQISKELAQIIFHKIKDESLMIPEFFQTHFSEAELRQIKYCRGKLGTQNIWPEFVPFIENLKNYSFHLLQINRREYIINVAELSLNTEEEYRAFLKNFPSISAEAEDWQTIQLQQSRVAIKNSKDYKIKYIQTPTENPDFDSFLTKIYLDIQKH